MWSGRNGVDYKVQRVSRCRMKIHMTPWNDLGRNYSPGMPPTCQKLPAKSSFVRATEFRWFAVVLRRYQEIRNWKCWATCNNTEKTIPNGVNKFYVRSSLMSLAVQVADVWNLSSGGRSLAGHTIWGRFI
jgi:hypothetical protein